MKLSELAEVLEQVSAESSRITKQNLVWEALQDASDETEEDVILALTTCDRFSDNGVAKKTVRKALARAFECDESTIREYESEHGSLPTAAEKASQGQSKLTEPEDVSLGVLWSDLMTVEKESGDKLQRVIEEMLVHHTEPKWVTHAVLADDGVSMGFGTKSAAKMLRRYHEGISKEMMAKARALVPDVLELNRLAPDVPTSPRLGHPFLPMLASSKDLPELRSITEVPRVIADQHRDQQRYIIQPKFDGARVLVHYDGDECRAFSRNTNEVTDSLPELTEVAQQLPDDVELILDGEAVAYKDDEPQDFQYIMTRFNRKHDVETQEMDVRFHFFDCVYYGDEPGLEDKSQIRRLDILEWAFGTIGWMDEDESERFGGQLDGRHPMVAQTLRVYSTDEMRERYQQFVAEGYEGAIIKEDDAHYEFDKRSSYWIKMKDSKEDVDLQILDVIEGEDDRAGKMGALQLGTAEEYPICKVGTGFSDEDLDYFWENREELIGTVVQIEWQELQKSAGEYSIRFPVFVSRREKSEADSLDRIQNL